MTDPLLHSSFYRFVALPDPARTTERVRLLSRQVLGSIVVAAEGISGVVAGPPDQVLAFEHALQHDHALDQAFAGMVFKHSPCHSAPFARIKVHLKPEIVAFGVDGVSAVAPDDTHVSPQDWRELIRRDDVVLIDNRNHFEYRLGHFEGAIDPQVNNFRDFAQWVHSQAPAWRAQGKTVAMYCTGGIRCEKTSTWMAQQGLPVRQLDGGILNFFQSLPDAQRDWQGECFVFDKRIALDTTLQETATTARQVYDPDKPEEAWRLERALRLDTADPL
jgi:UPF0176 protein